MKKTVMILAGGLLCSSLALAADNPDLIAQAKKEGSVTFNVWYLQPQWRSFVKDFEQQYGVKVRIPEGSIDGNMNKLLAEAGKAKGKIDVIALSVAQLPVTTGAKALAKVDDLPGYGDAIHQIQNVDTQGYAVAFWGNQTGFAYDPQQMGDRALPQTLEQLQSFIDANPKKFGYNDPNNGGAGEALFSGLSPPRAASLTAKRRALTRRW